MTVRVAVGDDAYFAHTTWKTLRSGGWVTWLPDGLP
jgi:hypothetical protein